MIKKGSIQVNVVADERDQQILDYLEIKLGLKKTQIFRLALRALEREERKKED